MYFLTKNTLEIALHVSAILFALSGLLLSSFNPLSIGLIQWRIFRVGWADKSTGPEGPGALSGLIGQKKEASRAALPGEMVCRCQQLVGRCQRAHHFFVGLIVRASGPTNPITFEV
jgi:hypothetical protein